MRIIWQFCQSTQLSALSVVFSRSLSSLRKKENMPKARSVTHLHLTGMKPSVPGGLDDTSNSTPSKFPSTQAMKPC
ncbi:hypothetical protein [Rufibacter immobilis]|uniref:hypothetical protein n=1 Tax=Rufibacter immobilis TaxID=1348778 RepID=UPI001C82BAA1|nr:hypothetical protein [Rufibacter immobilis]